MPSKQITLDVADGDEAAYLTLPDHPGRGVHGVVSGQVRLVDVLPYVGPDIYLDFDHEGRLIGVEVLV
ncbi:DUF2283 domain-containing protein [Dyella silvatica]|uniref:DUF2283 domain-containing protein n=1 Tax=Dyella silvatica TaxID=2992128 RepID=UPI003CCD26B7